MSVIDADANVVIRNVDLKKLGCGPMAKPHRMFLVTVVALWCAATPAAWQRHVVTGALAVVAAGCLVTIFRRLAWIIGRLRSAA